MIALFVTALTSTAIASVAVRAGPQLETSAYRTSQDNETVIIEIPANYCQNSMQCSAVYGFVKCENYQCVCDKNFYPKYNNISGQIYCQLCSQYQESCEESQCCQNSHATRCYEGMCVCRPGMDEECLGRYTPTLGIQLANTLSVSFAFVFLAITFIAVIRKTLFRCSFCRCDSMSRVASNSSINEFVKQKMQNRPPCYDDIEKDRKVPIDTSTSHHQPPPEYSSRHFGRVDTFPGVLNATFSISDEVEMNTAPPNYSTFTSVTDVTAIPTTSINREIILTRPIFMNSSFRQT